MSTHGRVEALAVNRCQFAALKQVADQAARAVRDQYRVWGSDILNPKRKIGCFADHSVVRVPVVATLAHEPEAGCDANPNVHCGICVDASGSVHNA